MAFLDDAGLVKLWQHIQARLSNKVDKAPGKVLSSNDFTDEEKNSLATISSDYLTSADKEELLAKLEENGGGGAFFEPDDGDLEGTTPTIDADTLGGLPPSSFVLADELEDKYIGANLKDVTFGESYITGVESILKPQLPLNLGEQFIAPITYYDQIILPDGSRWDGVSSGSGGGNIDIDISHLATREYVDEEIARIENIKTLSSDPRENSDENPELSAVPINADTLGGMTYQMIVDLIYPIGRTITTLDDIDNPNTLYPWQTWERAANGRFLLGADDNYTIGSEGGEAEHVLTVNELASHEHTMTLSAGGAGSSVDQYSAVLNTSYNPSAVRAYVGNTHGNGLGQPHNNMPPYLAANIWKRIA